MTAIEEIRKERLSLLTQEQKDGILASVKSQLKYRDYAVIGGASHYGDWKTYDNGEIHEAPFRFHPSIAEWLHTLGFRTDRYYNRGGVDNGLKIWF